VAEAPKRRWFHHLLDPSGSLGPGGSLAVAAALAAGCAVAAAPTGLRFDGTLDVHLAGEAIPWSTAALDQLVSWALTAAIFWLVALLFGRRRGPGVMLGSVGVARLPLALVAVAALVMLPPPDELLEIALTNPLHPDLLLFVAVALPCLAWCVTWLCTGFRTASGLRGWRLALAFVLALGLAEVGTKVVLFAPGLLIPPAPVEVEDPYELPGETPAERAEAFVGLLDDGRFDDAWRTFTPEMAGALPAHELAMTWRSTEAVMGGFEGVSERRTGRQGGLDLVDLVADWGSRDMVVRVVLDDDRVTGLWFIAPEDALPPG